MPLNKKSVAVATLLWAGLSCVPAAAKTMCVFDLMGTTGDTYALMKDFALHSQSQGVKLDLLAFTDEADAIRSYKNKDCDIMSSTGVTAREFNRFVSTLNAQGAIPNMESANIAMRLVANTKLQAEMVKGDHEVAGVIPMGLVYMLTNGSWFKQLPDLYGRTVGYLENDPAQEHAWERWGMKPVPLTVSTYSKRFNQGQLDVLPAPAIAIKPLELDKGLRRNNGVIVRYPVIFLSQAVIFDRTQFPANFGQSSRAWFSAQLPRMFRTIKQTELDLPKKYWMEVPQRDQDAYNQLMRQMRLRYVREGIYDKKMDSILQRVRCQVNPDAFDCKLPNE